MINRIPLSVIEGISSKVLWAMNGISHYNGQVVRGPGRPFSQVKRFTSLFSTIAVVTISSFKKLSLPFELLSELTQRL
jgi:hypothetical protein